MTCLLHRSVLSLATVLSLAPLHAHAVTIPTVPIGNPGNPPDTRYVASGIGSVPYSFRMGKFEVTNAQYVEFLNTIDPTGANTLALYSELMATSTLAGITFISGAADGAKYSVKAPALGGGYTYDHKPAVFVSWFSAIRFANWLHNGQGGPGTTEDGAYLLEGGTPVPFNAHSITRNPGARWWLPSKDEWYKSGYYDPVANVYYNYAMGTNSVPNNNPPSLDTGNSANFKAPNYTTGNLDYPLTDVGAYTISASPYGTFDQAGNVWEWQEGLIQTRDGLAGCHRGGGWNNNSTGLPISGCLVASRGNIDVGFRVATVIPEPSTLLLAALGLLAVFLRRRRRKAL